MSCRGGVALVVTACALGAAGCLSTPDSAASCQQRWSFDDCEVPAPIDNSFDSPGTYVLDTSDGSLRYPDQAVAINLPYAVSDDDLPVTIIALSELMVPADTVIRFVGIRPITLVVDGQVRIDGVLDASSRAGDPIAGAGSAIGSCSDQVDADDERHQSNNGGGGGGGGSLNRNGGRGGTGDGGGAEAAPAGTIPDWPGALRGGCPGGIGAVANGRDGEDSAAGGTGGGGLRLVASSEILVTGLIDASGAGGGGGLDDGGGGGGGGSGGVVWIETPLLTIGQGGSITAKGGGGGEGGSDCQGGVAGTDGFALGADQAMGGSSPISSCSEDEGDPAGGDGGGGSHGNFSGADDGQPGTDNEGGGGGGGSPGFVIIEADRYSARNDATSPPPATVDELD